MEAVALSPNVLRDFNPPLMFAVEGQLERWKTPPACHVTTFSSSAIFDKILYAKLDWDVQTSLENFNVLIIVQSRATSEILIHT